MIKTNRLTCYQDLVREGYYYILLYMKVIPQYKAIIGPYNYDKIIHNRDINYAKRQDIGHTTGKMHLILKIKICVLR